VNTNNGWHNETSLLLNQRTVAMITTAFMSNLLPVMWNQLQV